MSDLLELAVAAHGGWDRWQKLESLRAHISIDGAVWHLKGWPNVFKDAHVSIDPHQQHTEYSPFIEAGRRTVFDQGNTAIVTDSGDVIEQREHSRKAFEGHGLKTPWDAQHLIYFTGYAMWTYLTTPFLFKLPGFKVEEIEPWSEDGETWRRLKVAFPAHIETHSTEQIFYFDASGILKRHDYSVDIMGGTSSANYATEPKTSGGFVFPTRRRVYAIGKNNLPDRSRVAVAIDLLSIDVA
jgi:hypothetical protein